MGGRGMGGAAAGASRGVEEFITRNGVDEKAANSLRELRPDQQGTVLARGDLTNAQNPSSALMIRIKDAQAGGAMGGIGMMGGMMDPWSMGRMGGKGGAYVAAAGPSHEVEAFIMRNGLDEKAANSLRELGPDQQETVLARGDLTNAQNPSSALMMRIKDAQTGGAMGGMGMMGGKGIGSKGGKGGGGAAAGGSSDEVEAFIMAAGVDEKAARCLRELRPDQQQTVLARGELANCENPSSALMVRIKDARVSAGYSPY